MVILRCPEIKKYVFAWYVLNMDISVNSVVIYSKFSHIILDIYMKGTMSQIFDISSSYPFMKCGKLVFAKYQKVSPFFA